MGLNGTEWATTGWDRIGWAGWDGTGWNGMEYLFTILKYSK